MSRKLGYEVKPMPTSPEMGEGKPMFYYWVTHRIPELVLTGVLDMKTLSLPNDPNTPETSAYYINTIILVLILFDHS